ncbi:MAG: helix-turn-helix domain-containing protein [bacterium]|nr:helix-turn-helix domain-containing protein [bacterium]
MKLEKISSRFQRLRGDCSRAEFAAILGTTEKNIDNVENGRNLPGPALLAALVTKMQISPAWVLCLSRKKGFDRAFSQLEPELIGGRLRRLRKKKGLTLAAVGAAVGVTAWTVGTIERNDRQAAPATSTLLKFSVYYKCSIDGLMFGPRKLKKESQRAAA